MVRKRGFIYIALALALVGAACGSDDDETTTTTAEPAAQSDEGAAEDEPVAVESIKVGQVGDNSSYAWGYVAREAGFFEDNGLDVESVFIGSSEAIAGIVGGEMFGTLNIGTSCRASGEGVPVTVAYVGARQSDFVVLSNTDEVQSLTDLEGRSVITGPPSSSPTVALRAALEAAGVDVSQVEFVEVTSSADRPPLFLNKEADAMLGTATDYLNLQDQPGVSLIAEPEEFGIFPYTGLAVHEDSIEEDREVIKRYIRAGLETNKYILEHPAEVADIYAEVFDLTDEQAAELYDLLLPSVNEDGMSTEAMIETQAQLERVALETEVSPDEIRECHDFSIAEEVLAEFEASN